MDVPAWKLRELKEKLAGHWSFWINGRLTFACEDENSIPVDHQDPH
jgi:plasmid maintenance system killer protein